MSDPARNLPPYESGGRPAPGPLRDWLAAMKAQAPAAQAPAQPQV
ncbi:ATPase, partial [Methylobacterium sp. WL93]